MLTERLLETVLDRLGAQGAPIADALRPGLSVDQIDGLLSPLGLKLPEEAMTLWRWCDGGPPWTRYSIGPAQLISLRDAVSRYRRERALADNYTNEEEIDGDLYRYPRYFFPVTGAENILCVDCSVGPGEPAPVHSLLVADDRTDAIASPAATSLGQVVEWWIDAYEDGIWRYDPQQARWLYDHTRIPPERVQVI